MQHMMSHKDVLNGVEAIKALINVTCDHNYALNHVAFHFTAHIGENH